MTRCEMMEPFNMATRAQLGQAANELSMLTVTVLVLLATGLMALELIETRAKAQLRPVPVRVRTGRAHRRVRR